MRCAAFIVVVPEHENLVPKLFFGLLFALENVAEIAQTNVMLGTPHVPLSIVLHFLMVLEVIWVFEYFLALRALMFVGRLPLARAE